MTSPGMVGVAFGVLGRLANGLNFSQGVVGLTVVGTPAASSSTLSCVGVRSGSGFVRVGDIVTCIIVIRDVGGTATTGVAADFQTPVVSNAQLQSGLVSSADLMSVSFNVTAMDAVGASATVTVLLQGGPALAAASVAIGAINI